MWENSREPSGCPAAWAWGPEPPTGSDTSTLFHPRHSPGADVGNNPPDSPTRLTSFITQFTLKKGGEKHVGFESKSQVCFFFNAPMLACQPGGWQVHSRFWDILVPLLRWCWRKRSPPKLSALFGFLSKGS